MSSTIWDNGWVTERVWIDGEPWTAFTLHGRTVDVAPGYQFYSGGEVACHIQLLGGRVNGRDIHLDDEE